MKKISRYFILLAVAFLPSVVLAHVKWFAEPIKHVEAYSILDPFVYIGIISAVLIVLFGLFLEKKVSVPTKLNALIERLAPFALSIASIGFGLAFIIFSLKGFIFAPNLPVIGTIGQVMLVIQAVAGVMMLLGLYERISGLLLIVLFLLAVGHFGSLEMLDALEMLGFAFYVMIIGRPKWKITETNLLSTFTHHLHKYGYPILRVGTGLNLIILGFTEKILNPSLTDNFLSVYHWNFMQTLGFANFTDYHFAFYAGLVEVLFGVFFLFGLITRITTIVLAVFLVTTLILLGPIELVGHLPHFSIAIVLLVLGSGTEFTLLKKPLLKKII